MGAHLGIDLHRRRSLAVCLNEEGDRLWWRRFENSPENLAGILEEAGAEPEVAIEATWGWYWAADLITDMGGRVHPFAENRTEEPLVVQAIRDDDGHTFTAHLDESVDPGETDQLDRFARLCTEGHRLLALALEGEEMASTTESLCVGD